MFYIGPVNYQIHIKNTGPSNTALFVNGNSYSYETTITGETGFYIEYKTGSISPSGYAIVQVTGGTYIDSSLDTGMKRAANYNVLVSYGDNARDAELKSIADYEKEHNKDVFETIVGVYYDLPNNTKKIIIIVAVVAAILILIIAFSCCCCNKNCCCYCGSNEENEQSALQSDLISSSPGFNYRENGSYRIWSITDLFIHLKKNLKVVSIRHKKKIIEIDWNIIQ